MNGEWPSFGIPGVRTDIDVHLVGNVRPREEADDGRLYGPLVGVEIELDTAVSGGNCHEHRPGRIDDIEYFERIRIIAHPKFRRSHDGAQRDADGNLERASVPRLNGRCHQYLERPPG